MKEAPTHLSGAGSTSLAGQRDLIAFRLGQQAFALPIEPIVQIVAMVTITPIPQVCDVVAGVINVRGRTVPVVDMRRHLGLAAAPLQLHTPIILVQIGELVVGLIVDEVIDVFTIQTAQITRPAEILPEELGEAPVLQGLAHTPHGLVLLLDAEHLFLPHQDQALRQAAEILSELAVEEGIVGAGSPRPTTGSPRPTTGSPRPTQEPTAAETGREPPAKTTRSRRKRTDRANAEGGR